MSRFRMCTTLEGPAFREAFFAAASHPWLSEKAPDDLSVDHEGVPPTEDWIKYGAGSRTIDARWGKRAILELIARSEMVSIILRQYFTKVDDAIALLEPLPFEICCIGAAFFDEWLAADYKRWGFGRSHIDNGWGCAFRGRGHDRLVSRRWLDFGPWRVIRRPNDTTFIQFHDLALTDPAEAYAQAAPGLKRMGNDPTGGHIGSTRSA
jgi:hypothetical protein